MNPDLVLGIEVAIGIGIIFMLGMISRAWSRGGRNLPDDRLAAFESRLVHVEATVEKTTALAQSTDHDVRNIRMTLQSMPTKDSVNDVKVQLGEMKGELKAVTTTTAAMHHAVVRLENFLMDAAAKKIAGVPDAGSE